MIQPTHRVKSQLFRKVTRPSPVYLIPALAPTQGHPSRALQVRCLRSEPASPLPHTPSQDMHPILPAAPRAGGFPASSDWGAGLLGSWGKARDDMGVGAPALNITPLSPLKAQLISRMEEDVCFSDIQPQDLSPRRALRSLPPGCLSPWLDTGQNCSQRRGQGAPRRAPTLPPALAS